MVGVLIDNATVEVSLEIQCPPEERVYFTFLRGVIAMNRTLLKVFVHMLPSNTPEWTVGLDHQAPVWQATAACVVSTANTVLWLTTHS